MQSTITSLISGSTSTGIPFVLIVATRSKSASAWPRTGPETDTVQRASLASEPCVQGARSKPGNLRSLVVGGGRGGRGVQGAEPRCRWKGVMPTDIGTWHVYNCEKVEPRRERCQSKLHRVRRPSWDMNHGRIFVPRVTVMHTRRLFWCQNISYWSQSSCLHSFFV